MNSRMMYYHQYTANFPKQLQNWSVTLLFNEYLLIAESNAPYISQ